MISGYMMLNSKDYVASLPTSKDMYDVLLIAERFIAILGLF